ncbi:acyltransferase family protein [Salinimonas lutimaris]|uniref:acyltransferase family protein n=1 Tax=Salinimonas lutimaris TaxID=914153 RepID=UPI0010BFF30F|nr:acyltransferase family protein [Salinimonas lutimaris]
MQYRTEIDGLRALAIIPVLWLHAGFPGLSGGFLGVDVFFVISGFLITGIITREIAKGTFSIINFYERRARRILPALFLVIAVTTLLLPLAGDSPRIFADYGASLLSVATFVSNFYFWQTSGYFGSTSELTPMLHTWSLAVEEQYYIFFPLIALWALPRGKALFISLMLGIFIISLGLAQWQHTVDPIGNFYLLHTRAWELMAGGLASLFIQTRAFKRIPELAKSLLAIMSVVIVVVSYMWFTPDTAHPSLLTLAPVAGAVGIILFASSTNLTGRLLSTRLLTLTGLISYSLYLWHQPILAGLRIYFGEHLPVIAAIAGLVLSVVLAVISWHFVETPLRNRSKFTRPRIFKLSAAGLAAVILAGCVQTQNVAVRSLWEPENMVRFTMLDTAYESHLHQKMADEPCKIWSPLLDEAFTARFEQCAAKHNKAVFILGGSHGMDMYNAVAFNSKNPFVVSVSRGSCRAHGYNGNPNDVPQCQYEDFISFAKTHSDNIELVIYTQTPDRLFSNNDMFTARARDINQQYVDDVVAYLSQVHQQFSLPVLMIGMLPPITTDPVDWDYTREFDSQLPDYVSDNTIEVSHALDKRLASRLAEHGVDYYSKIDGFELQLPRDLVIDGKITYSDHRHITTQGEEVFGHRLLTHLFNKGYTELEPIDRKPTQQQASD